MRKILVGAALAVLCFSLPAFASNKNATVTSAFGTNWLRSRGTMTATTACSDGTGIIVPANAGGIASIDVRGTFTATLKVQTSFDGSNWSADQNIYPYGGGAAVSSVTAAGAWTIPLAAHKYICVYTSAYTSSPTVTVTVTQIPGFQFDPTAGAALVAEAPASGSPALSNSGLATLTTAVNVKATAGNLYGFSAVNGAASVCWFQCVDSATNGTLGTAVIYQAALPVSGTLTMQSNVPLATGSAGIACGIASAVNGASACGTAGNVSVSFK